MVKGGSYFGKNARELVAFSCRETLDKAVVTRDSRAIGHLGSTDGEKVSKTSRGLAHDSETSELLL